MSDATSSPPAPSHLFPPDPLPPIILGGTINLIAGAPGVGKSTWLAWFARQVQMRSALWGRQFGEVPWHGIICADRSWERSTIKWFQLEGMDALPAYSLQDDPQFKKARLRQKGQRIAVFEHCLNRLSPTQDGRFPLGSLVYVDPLALFLGGNLLDYDTCLVACSEIREVCLARGITIIGTAHAAKQKADKRERYLRLQDRILGSAALFGYTDTQMYLASPDEIDADYYAFLWSPHHAPTATFRMTRGADGRFLPGAEVVEQRRGQEGEGDGSLPAVQEIPGWLNEAFDGGPKTFAELIVLAGERGCSRPSLHRKLKALEQQGVICKPKQGLYQRVTH